MSLERQRKAPPRGTGMCEKCAELDAKIEHYQGLVDPAMDPVTRERVAQLIDDLMSEKTRLHTEPPPA